MLALGPIVFSIELEISSKGINNFSGIEFSWSIFLVSFKAFSGGASIFTKLLVKKIASFYA